MHEHSLSSRGQGQGKEMKQPENFRLGRPSWEGFCILPAEKGLILGLLNDSLVCFPALSAQRIFTH